MSKQKSGTVPQLPNKQVKGQGREYTPELMASYARRFGLLPSHMAIRQVRSLVKAKIDGDVWVREQGRKITMLEAKIAALLAFVGRYAKLKPAKVPQ